MGWWWRCATRLRRASGRWAVILWLCASLLTSQTSTAAGPPIYPSSQFGVVFINAPGPPFSNQTQRYSSALQAGAGWDRWVIYWSNVEAQCNQSYDWSGVNPVVNGDAAQGLAMDAILMGTPSCYQTTPGPATLPAAAPPAPRGGLRELSLDSRSPPTGLYRPTFADLTDVWSPGKSPNPANPWATFVFNAVSRYHGQVHNWEIWNEPDNSGFWTGSLNDYARLLKVAYLAAHSADGSARILLGGMMYWQWANQYGDQAWLKQFLPLLTADPTAAANGYYFDVIPWHWYSRSQDVYNKTLSAASVLATNGIAGKELWVNETNAPACNDPVLINGTTSSVNCADYNNGKTWADGYATITEQASFIIQASAYAFAAGATRVFEFQQQDDGNGQAFGLFRNDLTQRPIYPAYQLTAQYLEGFTVVRRTVVNGGEMVTFGVPSASPHRVTVLWNDNGTPVTATVAAAGVAPSSVSLIQQDGTTQALAPAASYSILLPGATDNRNYDQPWNPNDYIIGGQTMFLVENLPPDTTPPISAVAPLPAVTTPLGFAVTWSGSDPNGWGIFDYTVQDRDLTTGGPWTNWQTNTTSTSGTFVPLAGHTYQFRSLARDWAGNVESKATTQADATTTATGTVYKTVLPIVGNGGNLGR